MKILFCKISSMRYYKGASEKDPAYNGGSYVKENGAGHEEYNFQSVKFEDGEEYCLGFVETKSTSKGKRNDLHIEKISGCELMKKEDKVEDVLVVWCATSELNETSVVGWYKHATVYRVYESCEFDTGYVQEYNVMAKKDDCVLLPYDKRRRRTLWNAAVAKERGFGFGQSMIWYATEEKAQDYISKLVDHIDEYCDENWIDERAEEIEVIEE